MNLTVSLIYGSVRTGRKGIRVALYLKKMLEDRQLRVHFIDPQKYSLPLLDKMYKQYEKGKAPEAMETVAGMLDESDGYMVVTGEYNHGVPPALKNLLDHYQREYYFKPAAIASYSAGRYGGIRAALQLRSILAELGMATISTQQPFPVVQDAFSEDGQPQQDYIDRSTKKFIDEFEWYMKALKKQRAEGLPY